MRSPKLCHSTGINWFNDVSEAVTQLEPDVNKIAKQSSRIKTAIERLTTSRSVSFTGDEMLSFAFFQFKAETASFFYRTCGRTDIRVSDTPHFALAKALSTGAGISSAEAFYRDYLKASWGETEDLLIDRRVDAFKSHFKAVVSGSRMPRPVVTRMLPEMPHLILDGNHRISMYAAVGGSLRAELMTPAMAIRLFSKAPEFYGVGKGGMPYQSVFLRGAEVVRGRRNDALERMDLIPAEAIKGRKVLDIACNIGMSSKLAYLRGAAECTGLELSKGMVDMATKFAMFDDVYPHASFMRFDIDEDSLPTEQVYETAFAFSIHDHLKRPERLAALVRDHVTKFVVFEGHPGHSADNYRSFFESGLFSKTTLLGALKESVTNPNRNRNLWLCERV